MPGTLNSFARKGYAMFAAIDMSKFWNSVGDYWYMYLIGGLVVIMLYIWTKYENNPSGTAGRGTHSFGFGTIVFGFILGVFSTIAYLKANGQLPDVPGKSITTATLGNPKDYVDVSGDTLQRNSKPLPNGWRVALTQDEKTGTVIDDLVTMKAGSAWLYFDPDPTVHPSEKAKGKVKIR